MRTQSFSGSRRQRGFLELSTLFVLIVVALGIAGAVSAGLGLLGSSDVSTEQSNIGTLIANTRKLKSSSGYGTSGTNLVSQLVTTKGLPSMSQSGSNLYNSWNGAVTVVSGGMTAIVTDNGLPADACATLATKLSRGNKVTTTINGGTAITGEVDSATASSGCSKDSNIVSWTVY